MNRIPRTAHTALRVPYAPRARQLSARASLALPRGGCAPRLGPQSRLALAQASKSPCTSPPIPVPSSRHISTTHPRSNTSTDPSFPFTKGPKEQSRSRPRPNNILFSTAFAAALTLVLALTSSPASAEPEPRTQTPTEPGPLKQDLLPKRAPKVYASAETVREVVEILKARLEEGQVTVDDDELLAHGHSANTYHTAAKPQVVCYAHTTADVALIVSLANEHRIPVTPFSGGTSLEGHITCPFGGICIDLSRMDKIVEVHAADSDAVVQAGVQWEALNEELKEMGLPLFFPLDPGPSACIGGMMATGCSGTNAVRYGTAKGEWFLNATVVLPNGEIIKTRQRSRKSSAGFDLTKLFIGAEGTLGIVTEATIKLTPLLPTRVAVCGFPGVEEAVQAVGEVINRGVPIQCVELCDTLMMSAISKFGNVTLPLPDKDSIFFKFQGSSDAAMDESVRIVSEISKKYGGSGLTFAKDEAQSDELWRARKAAHWSAMALVPGGTCYSTDVCVPVSNLPRLVKETQDDLRANGIVGPLLGHVGDGNFHAALIFKKDVPGEFEKVDAAAHRMVERAIALQGTCTGEHGVGIGKKIFLRKELGDGTVEVMKTLKDALDPNGIMNPGKLYPD